MSNKSIYLTGIFAIAIAAGGIIYEDRRFSNFENQVNAKSEEIGSSVLPSLSRNVSVAKNLDGSPMSASTRYCHHQHGWTIVFEQSQPMKLNCGS